MNRSKPPRILGGLLTLLGVVLAGGGLQLVAMGGSAYFLVIGAGIACAGLFLALGRREGLYIYMATLAVILVWSVIAAGLDPQLLLPRILLPLLVGAYLLSGRVRARLA